MRYWLWTLFFLIPVFASAQQDTVRVCTYQLLDYSNSTSSIQNESIRRIIGKIDPDILVVQGVVGTDRIIRFFDSVVAPLGTLVSDPYPAPYDSTEEIAIFFDTTKVTRIGRSGAFRPSPFSRLIAYWTLLLPNSDTVLVYGCHLTSGNHADSARERSRSIDPLLEYYLDDRSDPPSVHGLVVGNLNIYSSDEFAYTALTDRGLTGKDDHFYDPVNSPGPWHHDARYSHIHTSSTRITPLGGGSGGGLTDRFDFILMSESLRMHYVPGSYTTFGNDGQHAWDSINDLPNAVVDDLTANALNLASDHLPVYADFVFPHTTTDVHVSLEGFSLLSISPVPIHDWATFTISTVKPLYIKLRIMDALGRIVSTPIEGEFDAGFHRAQWNAGRFPPGAYYYEMIGDRATHGKLIIIR